MRISGRDILNGQVERIAPGAMDTQVVIEGPGGIGVVSGITRKSAEELGLSQGEEVRCHRGLRRHDCG